MIMQMSPTLTNSRIFITILIVAIGHFFVDFMIGIWAVYKTIAFLDLAIAGLISALAAFIGEGLQVWFGPLSDRGYRRYLIMGGILATCASTCLAFSHEYFYLFLMFATTCIGSGAFHPSAVSLIGSLTATHKSLFISIFAMGGGLGLASSQLVYYYVYELFDHNTIVLGIPSILVVLMMILLRLDRKQVTAKEKRKVRLREYLTFFKNPALRNLYIIQVCNQAIAWGTIFLLPDVLLCQQRDNWICLGGGHLFFIIGGVLTLIPSGYIADKYSSKVVILTSYLISMITFYIFLFVPVAHTGLVIGLIFVLGAALGVLTPIVTAFGNKLVPVSQSGMVSAFLLGLAWCISEGLGQFGGGLLTKLFTEDASIKALGILGILFFVGLFAAFYLPGKGGEEINLKERYV
jgi:MFS transporter, FSR family, fosmidomycin resistance protein